MKGVGNMKRNSTKRKMPIAAIFLFVFLLAYALILILSIFWGFTTSFKTRMEYIEDRIWLAPSVFFKHISEGTLLNNYKNSLEYLIVDKYDIATLGTESANIWEMVLWSILYALGGSLAHAVVTFSVAYVTAKFDWKFSKIIYGFVVFTMSFQMVGTLPSQIQVAEFLGLRDTVIGVYFMKAHFLTVYYLVFYATVKGIPGSYFEAAKIDGASNGQLMIHVAFPLVKNIFLTVTLLFLIAYWNDYETPMLFMRNQPTVAYGIYAFSQKSAGKLSNVPARMAGCMLLLIPMLVLFVVFNKRLMQSISIGGLKE